MGYTALYRKFRPITFSEIVGQEHITRTLRNQIIAGIVILLVTFDVLKYFSILSSLSSKFELVSACLLHNLIIPAWNIIVFLS